MSNYDDYIIGQYTKPFNEALLEQMLSSMEVRAFSARNNNRTPNRMWIDFGVDFQKEACEAAGVDWGFLIQISETPMFYMSVSEDIAPFLVNVYGQYPGSIASHCYLQLLANRRVCMKFQRIIGSHPKGTISEEQLTAIKRLAAAKLADAYKNHPDFDKARRYDRTRIRAA